MILEIDIGGYKFATTYGPNGIRQRYCEVLDGVSFGATAKPRLTRRSPNSIKYMGLEKVVQHIIVTCSTTLQVCLETRLKMADENKMKKQADKTEENHYKCRHVLTNKWKQHALVELITVDAGSVSSLVVGRATSRQTILFYFQSHQFYLLYQLQF